VTRLTLAGFNASIAAGTDWLTAVGTMSPALDRLATSYKTLGIQAPTSLQSLLDFRQRCWTTSACRERRGPE